MAPIILSLLLLALVLATWTASAEEQGQEIMQSLAEKLVVAVEDESKGICGSRGKYIGSGCSVFCPCNSGMSCHPGWQECYSVPRQRFQPCSVGYSCGKFILIDNLSET